MTTKKARQPVLVTTEHRGVFFGYLVGKASKASVVLTDCRNCLRWTTDVQGFVGLATDGPSASCRVGPAAPGKTTLYDVTSVIEATPAAAAQWETAPWGR